MTNYTSTKADAIELLKSGLATQSEVAGLAGVSRQLIRKWVIAAGVNPKAARREWLERAWKSLYPGCHWEKS